MEIDYYLKTDDDHAPREKNSGGKYRETNAHMYIYQKETLIIHALQTADSHAS